MNQLNCTLPGGYIDQNGTLHKQVVFAPLSGKAEALVAGALPGPALVTQLLHHSVQQIGSCTPSEELMRSLLVADRQYLLLKLREATLGNQIYAVLRCSFPSCGNKMDIDFTVDDIPIEVRKEVKPDYTIHVSAVDGPCKIVFRLPNGSDQETLVPLLADNLDEDARKLLLQRCIQQIEPAATDRGTFEKFLPTTYAEIEEAMVAVAPRIELIMEGGCPECGHPFAIPFDLEKFVLKELSTSHDQLYREVHHLAFHYHWGEREIMEMPRTKRRRYLEILTSELEKMSNAT